MISTITISALTGGLAGSVATNFFTIWRDRRNRRFSFRCEMDVLMGRTPTDNVDAFHASTREKVRDLCSARREDIRRRCRAQFIAAGDSYYEAKCGLESWMLGSIRGSKHPTQEARPQREILVDALETLKKCAR